MEKIQFNHHNIYLGKVPRYKWTQFRDINEHKFRDNNMNTQKEHTDINEPRKPLLGRGFNNKILNNKSHFLAHHSSNSMYCSRTSHRLWTSTLAWSVSNASLGNSILLSNNFFQIPRQFRVLGITGPRPFGGATISSKYQGNFGF